MRTRSQLGIVSSPGWSRHSLWSPAMIVGLRCQPLDTHLLVGAFAQIDKVEIDPILRHNICRRIMNSGRLGNCITLTGVT